MSDNNLHEHHRMRMREKYRAAKEAMPDHEILEILLYSVIKRKNTNPIAHKLCKRFGSLKGVLEADEEALKEVEGVGDATAGFLKEISYIAKRFSANDAEGVLLDSITKIGDHLVNLYKGKTREAVYLLMLDSRAKLIACQKLCDGTISSSNLSTRRIVEIALLHHAPRVILAHNHPNGSAAPSDDDIVTTRYLRRAFSMIDLTLEEHFIVAGDEFCPVMLYLREHFQTN